MVQEDGLVLAIDVEGRTVEVRLSRSLGVVRY